jgi:hypothetical protein
MCDADAAAAETLAPAAALAAASWEEVQDPSRTQ